MMSHAVLVCLVCLFFGSAFVAGVALRNSKGPSERSLKRAKDILDLYPVIDGHNDFPMGLRDLLQNDIRAFDFNSSLAEQEPWASYEYGSIDLPRIREGRLGGQFWVSYVNCRSQHKDALQLFIEQIDVTKRLVAAYPEDMAFVTDAAGIERALAEKKVASLIGVESGHAINSNMATLRMLYELGTRYITLTHSCNTPWADAAQSESGSQPVRSNGLSEFGRKIVLEMNRLGMFVDISHVSSNVMRDALDVTRAPLIFSHSSARTISQHVRNVPDDVLERMPQNGGVVMVNFYPCFLDQSCEADVNTIVAHINHIRTVAGVDHVGIGSDFCGIEITPTGVEDASKYPYLFAALLESTDVAWTEEDLAKLANQNLIRAMREMEAVRDSLTAENAQPDQDWIPVVDYLPEETLCMSDFVGDKEP